MFEKLTPTQKNFRKEMKKIEEENRRKREAGEAPEEFYSHYKRNMVRGYYDAPKTKRRVIQGVSLSFVLLALWNSYAIFTWVNHFYRNITNTDLPVVAAILDPNGTKQREFAAYLDSEKQTDSVINWYLSNKKQVSLGLTLPTADYQWRVDALSSCLTGLNAEMSVLASREVPDYASNYKAAQIQGLQFYIDDCVNTISWFQCKTVDEYNQFSAISHTLQANKSQIDLIKNNELIAVFNDLGIKYEIQGNGFRYYIKQ